MDGLSLLCTLHADGPTSLKRLRGVGCLDLEAFLARPTEELAHILDVTPAHARRLRREAGLLRERVGGGILQEEEGSNTPPRQEEEAVLNTGELSSLDRAILGRVLENWRERDRLEGEPEARLRTGSSLDEERALEQASSGGLAEFGQGFGMSLALIEELGQVGITGLADLVAVDPTELASHLALPFSEVRRWQYLAARQLPEQAEMDVSPEPAAVPVVSAPPAPSTTKVGDLPFGAGIEGQNAAAWNFEIPRYQPGRRTTRRVERDAPADQSGGPFA